MMIALRSLGVLLTLIAMPIAQAFAQTLAGNTLTFHVCTATQAVSSGESRIEHCVATTPVEVYTVAGTDARVASSVPAIEELRTRLDTLSGQVAAELDGPAGLTALVKADHDEVLKLLTSLSQKYDLALKQLDGVRSDIAVMKQRLGMP